MYIIIIIKSTLHAGWLVDALFRSKPGLCWLFAAAVLCCCCVVLLLCCVGVVLCCVVVIVSCCCLCVFHLLLPF